MVEQDILSENPFTINQVDKGTRFGNLFFDRIVCLLIELLVGILIGIFIAFNAESDLAIYVNGVIDDDIGERIFSFIIAYFVSFIYYFTTESLGQRTLGKLITKTIVVDAYGNKPNRVQIFKRSLSRLIPFEAFSFFGTTGWHDSLSDTYVVRYSDYKLYHSHKSVIG